MLFLCNIANIAQRTFGIVQKSRSCKRGDIIISARSLRTYIDCTRESRDFHVQGTAWHFKKVAADFACDNGIIEVSLLHV